MELLAIGGGAGIFALLVGIAVFIRDDLSPWLKTRSTNQVKIQELKVEEARLKLEETQEVRRMNQEAVKLTEAEARLPQKPLSDESNAIT